MKGKIFFILVNISWVLSIGANSLPIKCESKYINHQDGKLVLHTVMNYEPQLVLIHNKTKRELVVNHSRARPSASAGWSSQLHPDSWSALMVTQPKFSLTCAEMRDEKYVLLDCSKVLESCYYTKFQDQESAATGTYWIAENFPLIELMGKIRKRKIILDSQENELEN